MEGLVEEGAEMIKEDELDGEALDAGLISRSPASRAHTRDCGIRLRARTYANLLGESDAAGLLGGDPQGREGNGSEAGTQTGREN